VRAYVRTAVINRIRDEVRRGTLDVLPDSSSLPPLDLNDPYRRYRDALERLEPHDRERIRQRAERTSTWAEIQREFGDGPVRRAVRRVVQWLMKLIGRDKD